MGAALKIELPEPPEFRLPTPANTIPSPGRQRAIADFLVEVQATAAAWREFADQYMAFVSKLKESADIAANKALSASGPKVLYALAEDLEQREHARVELLLPQLDGLRLREAQLDGMATSVSAPLRPVLRDLIEAITTEFEVLRDLRIRLIRIASEMAERGAPRKPIFSSSADAIAFLKSRLGK